MFGVELSFSSNLKPILSKIKIDDSFIIVPYLSKRFGNIPIYHDLATMFSLFHLVDINVLGKQVAVKLKINCDNAQINDDTRKKYISKMLTILNNLHSCSLATIILEVGEESSVVSELIASFCSKVSMKLCLQFPLVFKKKDEMIDSWIWWNKIRTECNYSNNLCVILDINKIDVDSEYAKRWLSEPIFALLIHSDAFLLNIKMQPVLKKAYQEIIRPFIISRPKLILKNVMIQSNGFDYCFNELQKLQNYLKFFVKECSRNITFHHISSIDYCDRLQTALQPQTDFLDSFTYSVFEEDDVKYSLYEKAIRLAYLSNMKNFSNPMIIVIAGAGRGPLVQAALNVINEFELSVKLYAIERNPIAITILRYLNKTVWNDTVEILSSDMRKINMSFKISILISELLGSFGDNELSPECLYPLQKYFDEFTVCIPQSYTSCIAPLQYPKILHQIVTEGQLFYDYPYVTYLVKYFEISKAKDLFTFVHPSYETVLYNKYGSLQFTVTQNCLLNAFVGYFRCILYGDVILSIEPATYSTNMFSWFPIVFPLSQAVTLKKDDVIEVNFWRKHSIEYVWYEWVLCKPISTRIQNLDGCVYRMKKMSDDA